MSAREFHFQDGNNRRDGVFVLRIFRFQGRVKIVPFISAPFTTDTSSMYLWSQVVMTDFSAQDWEKHYAHYTIVVEAAIDNKDHGDDVPLAPWY